MSRQTREFLPLSDAALRAVSGPNSRHAALLEDAFHVLVETPGGGVSLSGDAKGRAAASQNRRKQADARAADPAPVIARLRASGVTSLYGIAKALTALAVPTPDGREKWQGL